VQHGNAYVRVSTAGVYHGGRTDAGSRPSLEFSQAGLPAHKQGPVTMTRRTPGTDRDSLVTVRIVADGAYLKMYVNEQRVANVPNAACAHERARLQRELGVRHASRDDWASAHCGWRT